MLISIPPRLQSRREMIHASSRISSSECLHFFEMHLVSSLGPCLCLCDRLTPLLLFFHPLQSAAVPDSILGRTFNLLLHRQDVAYRFRCAVRPDGIRFSPFNITRPRHFFSRPLTLKTYRRGANGKG